MKLLDIGSGDTDTAKSLFGEHAKPLEVVRLDNVKRSMTDVVHNIVQPLPKELEGQFDIVLASHVFNYLYRADAPAAWRNAARALKNHGEMWAIVPSVEWAANEVLLRRDGIAVQTALYGGQSDKHDFIRCSFTLPSMRYMMESSGLLVKKAFTAQYQISTESGKTHRLLQNICIGTKAVEITGDASTAISS